MKPTFSRLGHLAIHLALIASVGRVFTAFAYLPPVDERVGVRVEIKSFPQKIERTGKDRYAWPLGVTEVSAGQPRAFPIALANMTTNTVAGTLEVWLNDDWTVTGPAGAITLTPHEKRELVFTATAKGRALEALYPVHARFTPTGIERDSAPHPIAVFDFHNPAAPRAVVRARETTLSPGAYRLDDGFARTTAIEVGGTVRMLAENGAPGPDRGSMMTSRMTAGGCTKPGFRTHPPYRKGAGYLWSDFMLTLPNVKPIVFRTSNFLVSPGDQPPSDGVEYRVVVREGTNALQTVAGQIVKEPLVWKDMSADLSPWAGKCITLRLWTGPGPKMNTCCDGGGWGDVRLEIGPQPAQPNAAEWQTREARAVAAAKAALAEGTDDRTGRWRLEAEDGVFGAGVAFGARGLIDGALAFTDGARSVTFRGFTAETETSDGNLLCTPVAEIRAERGTLRIKWSIPGAKRNARGTPRIIRLAPGATSVNPARVYAGFGNVIEGPKRFVLEASGFALSTRHVGADYENGFSIVQAVDVPPDRFVCDGTNGLVALEAHHDACYTFAPSAKGAFAAARRFRAVAGYRKSPGRDTLGARMCLDQWGGDYARAADDLRRAAKYGLADTIYVRHVWQRWGYDYRLPEIWPPEGNRAAFDAMRAACRETGILFCPHDNYTDIYPDAEGFSYDNVVFNLDGTPQKAWFNAGRHARSYRFAPHRYLPWCAANARRLASGCDPDAVFIDVFTAHGPFDYLDRNGNFHTKMETSAAWGKGFALYREGYGKPNAVCVSEAGQDHLVGIADAGQSDHFSAAKLVGAAHFTDAERTPWHDIVTHGYYTLFAGGLGGRYQEEAWHKGGDRARHGYASDDYLSNAILGGRNAMCDGPFNRDAVKTYWLQHDACAELGRAEFRDLRYEGNIHRQHAFFSDGGEVWVNRATNATWRIPNGVTLPPYGYWAKTKSTTSGIVLRNGVRGAYARAGNVSFFEAGDRTVKDTAPQTVSFGDVSTDGAFRLERRDGEGVWIVTPLPRSRAFAVTFDLAAFGAPNARVTDVEAVEAAPGAAKPVWKQDAARVTLRVDARAFAYRLRLFLGIRNMVFRWKDPPNR